MTLAESNPGEINMQKRQGLLERENTPPYMLVEMGIQKIALFRILLHQWLENFYLTSANIGNRKMNSAEFHK